jgi:hypothetical protein
MADALVQDISSITNLRRLEIMWGEFYPYWGWGRPSYNVEPTTALDVFAPVICVIWRQVAPTLQELCVGVYVDALSVVAALDVSLAPGLRALDLRVYGGVIPETTGPAGVEAHLAAIARAVVLPTAGRLEALNVSFVPCNSGSLRKVHNRGPNAPPSFLPAFPEPLLNGFFELIRASRYPRLRHLGVDAPFLGSEHPLIASLVTMCLKHGRLESLALTPTFPRGSDHNTSVAVPYMHMIRDLGGLGGGLRALSLFFMDSTRVEAAGHPLFEVGTIIVPFMHPFLSALSLQELLLTGHFMTAEVLQATLQVLHHGCGGDTLRRLAVKVETVRPSTFDILFELAPSIESLDLEIGRTLPDGEITPVLLCSVQAEMNLRALQPVKTQTVKRSVSPLVALSLALPCS